jgi:hypothetical protein
LFLWFKNIKKKKKSNKNEIDYIYLKAIDENVIYELTYNREIWRDLLKAAMVLNGPVS